MQSRSTLLRVLPYAGALPFIGCVLLLLLHIRDIPYLGDTTAILLAYGLTIVSFMAGVHWGQYLAGVHSKINLLITSNAVALLAWASFLLWPPALVCWSFVALFAALYFIDTRMHLTPDYLQTRRNVTLIVCTSLAIAALIQRA